MQSSKFFSILFKITIVFMALWFLYDKLFLNESILDVEQQFFALLNNDNKSLLALVLLLMVINWSIEALKWQYLISKLEKVTFWLAIKAVFLGITVSIFTPNRVGEFGGRVFCLEKADRIKAVLVTILGNLSQLLSTIIFGSISFIFFVQQFLKDELITQFGLLPIIFFLIVFVGALVFLFLHSSFLTFLLSKIKFLNKYLDYIQVFSLYTFKELLNILLISILRFLIFSFQFYLLICFVEIEISFLQSLMMSSLTFLAMSIIPTIALTELGVRGSVAVYFFGFITSMHLAVVLASFSLWAINLVIPALIGLLFVYQLKFFRS